MPAFKYKAVSRDGAKINGVVEAYDKFEAISKIKADGALVSSITQVPEGFGLNKDLFANRKVKDKTLALLCSQFAIILKTGLPVVRAVELICDQTNDRQLKKLLRQVTSDVAGGYSLSASLGNKGGKILPTTFIETVRAGEESGTLEASFERLHTYYENSAQVKTKVRSAMRYPIFLLCLAALVIAIIMGFAMPRFAKIFEDMNIEMPGLTQALINVSNFVAKFWWLMIAIVAAIAIAVKLYSGTEKGGLKMAKLSLRLPALGRVSQMKGASQFANTMCTLLTAGVPLIRATEIVGRVLDNRYLGWRLGMVLPYLEEGKQLGEQLRKEKVFPEMLCEMTAMGEDTGSMEETMGTIGIYYDAETALASEKALAILQPAITVIMGILIGLIVVSLYLPMLSMYNGM